MKIVAIMRSNGKAACTIDGIRQDHEFDRWPVPNVNHEAMIEPTYQSTLNCSLELISSLYGAQKHGNSYRSPLMIPFHAVEDGPARSASWVRLSW